VGGCKAKSFGSAVADLRGGKRSWGQGLGVPISQRTSSESKNSEMVNFYKVNLEKKKKRRRGKERGGKRSHLKGDTREDRSLQMPGVVSKQGG